MLSDDEGLRKNKIMLFWMVYMMDRNISLRLGYAPAIQDHDISLPKLQPSTDLPEPIVQLMSFWIDLSRIQGQICEQLYSPAALTQPNEARARRAEVLAEDLKQGYETRVKVNGGIISLFSQTGHGGHKVLQ